MPLLVPLAAEWELPGGFQLLEEVARCPLFLDKAVGTLYKIIPGDAASTVLDESEVPNKWELSHLHLPVHCLLDHSVTPRGQGTHLYREISQNLGLNWHMLISF